MGGFVYDLIFEKNLFYCILEEKKEKEPEWHPYIPEEASPILTGYYSEEGKFWLSMVSHYCLGLSIFFSQFR